MRALYTLRVLEEAKMANYSDTVPFSSVDDYMEDAADDLLPSYSGVTREQLLDPDGEHYEEVMDAAWEMMYENQPVVEAINDVLHRYDYKGTLGSDIMVDAASGRPYTWNDIREQIDDQIATGNLWADDGNGNNITSGGLLSEILQELDYDGVVDQYSAQRFPSMRAGEHTVVFPGKEHVIRPENAAYDPQYRGTNMMGNADPRLLAATGLPQLLGVLACLHLRTLTQRLPGVY